MPAYSFKPRFVPFVKDKTKTQTVRSIRKHPPKPGQPVTLLTGSRFKPVKILEEKPPVECVDTIFILPGKQVWVVTNTAMSKQDADLLLKDLMAKKSDSYKAFEAIGKGYKIQKLSAYGKNGFAWHDGFRPEKPKPMYAGCFDMMMEFWKHTHALPFAGHVTYWKF